MGVRFLVLGVAAITLGAIVLSNAISQGKLVLADLVTVLVMSEVVARSERLWIAISQPRRSVVTDAQIHKWCDDDETARLLRLANTNNFIHTRDIRLTTRVPPSPTIFSSRSSLFGGRDDRRCRRAHLRSRAQTPRVAARSFESGRASNKSEGQTSHARD